MKCSFQIRIIALIIVNLCVISCTKKKSLDRSLPFKNHNIIYKNDTILNVNDSMIVHINLDKHNFPIKQMLRVIGEGIYPQPFKHRGESTFQNFVFQIEDYLDSVNVYKNDKYSLLIESDSILERNLYYRIDKQDLKGINHAIFSLPVKVDKISKEYNNGAKAIFNYYFDKKGRHVKDVYDQPDTIIIMDIPYKEKNNWRVLKKRLPIPKNTANILFNLNIKEFDGQIRIGNPTLRVNENAKNLITPFKTSLEGGGEQWVGENFSSKEWLYFEVKVDKKIVFSGRKFDRASDISIFEVQLPALNPGEHEIIIKKIKNPNSRSYPFKIRRVEIAEESNRNFEVVHVPKYVYKDKTFTILVKTNQPGITLQFDGNKTIKPFKSTLIAKESGLYPISFKAAKTGVGIPIIIKGNNRLTRCMIKQVLSAKNDHILLSSSSDVYINRNKKVYETFLQWYFESEIANAYIFRPSYYWSGSVNADKGLYQWISHFFYETQTPFALMADGRTIPAKNINPDESYLNNAYYLGRQAHEDDGSFYYWGTSEIKGLYTDIASRSRTKGSIFPRMRLPFNPKNQKRYQFYRPDIALNMEEAAEYFVENVKKAKGRSTRHTGPSTLFRYLYQAGYDWLGAELMYGPDEVTMASLRGASRAYGRQRYGTHHATPWSSKPFDAPEHADRSFLSLATAYIQGATHINNEKGLWSTEFGFDRYTESGKEHIEAQRRIMEFIKTHDRSGSFHTKIAVLQGRNDGWSNFSFTNTNLWGQKGKQWDFNEAEQSFELLHLFYPRSKFEPIYRFPCEKQPQGWFTGTPYGAIDILPIEAPQNVLNNYRALIFLGWNSYKQEDFQRLLTFVRNGGTLLLSRAHINIELRHNKPAALPKNDPVLSQLLGSNYFSQNKDIIKRVIGKGNVIYFSSNTYPANHSISNEYLQAMKVLALEINHKEHEKGWIQANENVSFVNYDISEKEARKIFLLNIDWWSEAASHKVKLFIGNSEFEIPARKQKIEMIFIKEGLALMPSSQGTDIIDIIKEKGDKIAIIQTIETEKLSMFYKDGKIEYYSIPTPGIHKVKVN